MNIVLIHVKENFTPVPPTGLLYVGTMLKKEGHNVWVFDVNIKEKDFVIKKIKEIDPDLVGFSAMTTSYSITRDFNRDLRKEVPYAYYCWGGVHATALPLETIKENNLDFLVYGEGELTIAEVCRRIRSRKNPSTRLGASNPEQGVNLEGIKGVYYVDGGEIRNNPPRAFVEDLDSLPIPDRSLLENFKWYLSPPGILRGRFRCGVTTMYTSRGCPFQCIFCASRIIHGSSIRRRSVDNVLEEMAYLKNNFGVTGIYFNDDTFATDIKWLEEFCGRLRSGAFGFDKMIWGCQTRASIARNLDILKMMKGAGCAQVDIGCESGSDKILENLKKGITSQMILESFANLKRVKMKTFATFILGNPGETMEDVKKTEQVAKKAPGAVSFLILVPYPGSPLFKMALDNKWFVEDNNIVFDDRWTNKQSDSPVMQASFRAKDLVKIRADLQNKFFFKNNISTILAFIKSPYFLYRALMTVLGHPLFICSSIARAARKRKIMDFLEDIYQKFNEDLRK